MNMNDEGICGHLVPARKKRVNADYLELSQEFDRLRHMTSEAFGARDPLFPPDALYRPSFPTAHLALSPA